MESSGEGRPGQPQPLGLTEFDERRLYHFQGLKESLEWKDGKPPDPEEVREVLAHIALNVQPIPFLGEVGTPDHKEFTENMQNVRDAFTVVAYPYMNEGGQLTMGIMYRWRRGEQLTITPRQKGMLTMITTAAGIPDDPQQLTYSFSSISPAPTVIEGSAE